MQAKKPNGSQMSLLFRTITENLTKKELKIKKRLA